MDFLSRLVMMDHQPQDDPKLQAFEPVSADDMQVARQRRDEALSQRRPLSLDATDVVMPIQTLDTKRPLSREVSASLKPQVEAVSYQRLVADTLRMAFMEPCLSIQDLLPYRIKAAWRIMREMARFRGYLEIDASLMEMSDEQWLKPQPLRSSTVPSNGFRPITEEVRVLCDKSERISGQYQTPVLTEDGKIKTIPGLALMPPPIPFRFRDKTTGAPLPDYNPENDVNLIYYCKVIELVARDLYVRDGSKWDKQMGRYGLLGLLDPREARAAMPSWLQMIAWEEMIVEEVLSLIVKHSTEQAARRLIDKYGLMRHEINSLIKMAKYLARTRTESEIEEDRGLMLLRLEDLIRRSKKGLDLRVEVVALKQMAQLQQLTMQSSTTMDDFIKVIQSVSNERKQKVLPVITQNPT